MVGHSGSAASELTCTDRMLLSQIVYEKGTEWESVASLLDGHPLVKGRRELGFFSAPVSSFAAWSVRVGDKTIIRHEAEMFYGVLPAHGEHRCGHVSCRCVVDACRVVQPVVQRSTPPEEIKHSKGVLRLRFFYCLLPSTDRHRIQPSSTSSWSTNTMQSGLMNYENSFWLKKSDSSKDHYFTFPVSDNPHGHDAT
jgi:hypothetical protein